MFQRNVLSPLSGSKSKPTRSICFLPVGCLLGLLLDSEDGDNTFLRNVGKLLLNYTASHDSTTHSDRHPSTRVSSFAAFSSLNILMMFKLRKMRWKGYVARMGKMNWIDVGKPEGRYYRWWNYIIKMVLRQMGCVVVGYVNLITKGLWRKCY
jgi:hypothetical protein